MPIITVNLLEGRPDAAKRKLIEALALAAEETLGVPLASVRVILNEVPPRHWGIGNQTKADLSPAIKDAP